MNTPHPQAEILRAIADGKTIQVRHIGHEPVIWQTVEHPLVFIGDCATELRIESKTVAINNIEVPCPVREKLKVGDKYWIPDVKCPDGYLYDSDTWDGYVLDMSRLKAGVIHLTKESAIAHAEALLSFTRSDK